MERAVCIAKKTWFRVIVSAVFAALPLTFPSCFLFSWIAYVPFFLNVVQKSGNEKLRNSVGRWFLFGLLFNLGVYYWFLWLYPLDFMGFSDGMSAFIAVFAWLIASLFQGLFYIIPGIMCHFAAKKLDNVFFTAFAAVIGVMIAIWFTEVGELAFPWIRVSLGQYRVPVLIQSASVFGVEGVDFIILSVNAFFALALLKTGERRRILSVVAVGIFAVNLVFGIVRLSYGNEGRSVRVLAVQGNVLVDEKWEGKTALEYCSDLYSEMSMHNISDNTELVVWPETAVPVNLAASPKWQRNFMELSETLNVPVYMGINWRENDLLHNSAVLVKRDSLSEPCFKRMLVPFGEKLPYENFFKTFFPFLEEFNIGVFNYVAGSEVAVMNSEFGKIGNIICFESIFPTYARECVDEGAQALFTITNDAWLEDSPAAYQHLAHSVFRCVENSKEMVRCANVGSSAFIDERGRISVELASLERATIEGDVGFSEGKTLYVCGGYLFFPAIIVIYAICFVLFRIRKKRTMYKM